MPHAKLVLNVIVGVWLLVPVAGFLRAAEVDPTAERIARLKSLPADKKERLDKKQKRFEALPAAEQTKLRLIDQQISASSNGDKLKSTLTNYHTWLKTLTSSQQTELASAADDEARLKIIHKLQKQQEEERRNQFRKMAGEQASRLPPEDMEKLYQWIDSWMQQHQDQLPDRVVTWIRDYSPKNEDPSLQRRKLMMYLLSRQPPGEKFGPTTDEFKPLLPQLSAATREMIDKAPNEGDKRALVMSFVRFAVFTKGLPPVTEEQLRKFFTDELSREKQAELQKLPPAAMRQELVRQYHWHQRPEGRGPMMGPGPGNEGGPRGPFGPGRRPDGEHRDGRPPDGKRSDRELGPNGPPPEGTRPGSDDPRFRPENRRPQGEPPRGSGKKEPM